MEQLLKFLNTYGDFSKSEEKVLVSICALQQLKKNDFFLLQGEPCNKLAFMQNGSLRYFRTTISGDEVNTEFLIHNGFVTDFIPYTLKQESTISIQALENSELIVFDFHKQRLSPKMMKKLKLVGSNYMKKVCLPFLIDYQLILAEKPSLRYSLLQSKYPVLIQKIPQKHLASLLRLTPETVSRIRKKILDLNQLDLKISS